MTSEQEKDGHRLGIARRLIRARLDAKLSRRKVQEKTGISARTLRAYEKAQHIPGGEALGKLAVLYGVTADYLLGVAEGASEDDEKG